VLADMRANIKRALYNDMLGNPNKTPMSATEVAERMADLARQIGAAFGRLQVEMVQPVIQRVVYILKELGLIVLPTVNGREVRVEASSPLAQAQNQQDIMNVDRWIGFLQGRFGPQATNLYVKGEEVSAYMAEKLQVPNKLARTKVEQGEFVKQLSQMADTAMSPEGQEQIAA
jgi:hypothetical protein